MGCMLQVVDVRDRCLLVFAFDQGLIICVDLPKILNLGHFVSTEFASSSKHLISSAFYLGFASIPVFCLCFNDQSLRLIKIECSWIFSFVL